MLFFLQVLINGILIGGVYSLISLPVVMIYKSSKVFNFAQGSILMLGAWITWALVAPGKGLGLPWWLGIILSLVIAIILGIVVERLALRKLIGQPLFSIMIVTLGLSAVFIGVTAYFWGTITGTVYPHFIPATVWKIGAITIASDKLIVFLIAVALIGLVSLFFKYQRYGLGMRAVAESHHVAESLGIRVTTILRANWALACAITFTAGILLASMTSVNHTLDSVALLCFVVILMGGLESIPGVLVAGPIVGVIEQLTGQYIDRLVGGGFMEVIPYIVLIIVVLILPYGIFGLKRIERI